ncbi:MAG: hypothetical protein ACLR3C_15710 [Eggerthella lenta]
MLPNKDILDAAYPDRPVCLQSGDSHTLWVNSKKPRSSASRRTRSRPPAASTRRTKTAS